MNNPSDHDVLAALRREVPTAELAVILNLSPRRVRQLAEAGVLDRSDDGDFEVIAACQQYFAYLRGESEPDIGALVRAEVARALKARQP